MKGVVTNTVCTFQPQISGHFNQVNFDSISSELLVYDIRIYSLISVAVYVSCIVLWSSSTAVISYGHNADLNWQNFIRVRVTGIRAGDW